MAAVAVVIAVLAGCSSAPAPSGQRRTFADLTNPFLGPEYSAWLVGPISRLASEEEISAFLALRDDAAAGAFVEAFWARRDAGPDLFGTTRRQTFEERGEAADRLYSEAGIQGRRTARGTIYVVYGPPTKTEFEVSPEYGGPPIELWIYDAEAPAGLDGRRPGSTYRFIKQGDLTVPYSRTRPQRRPNDPRFPPPGVRPSGPPGSRP